MFPGRVCRNKGVGVITRELVEAIRKAYALDWGGMHGMAHWLRVRENGLRLAELTGADRQVVKLFAFIHDAKRLTDWPDPEHGRRAAEFAETLRGSLIVLPDRAFRWLVYACEWHSDGLTEAPPTVQTCWDADRLDLGRIGVRPDPRFLCTAAAKDGAMIEWAFTKSQQEPENSTWLDR